MTSLTEKLQDKLFEIAEVAKFSPEQIQQYENSLKYYRDLKNSLDTAFDEGKEEGVIEERTKIVTELLKNNIPVEVISKSTGLSVSEIENIKS